MKRYLLALCGIPASGKSTLAVKLHEYLYPEEDVKIVGTDQWRNRAYYSEFTPEKENEVRNAALRRTRQYLAEGMSVIHDDTNYYASMRHELYVIAMEKECCFGIIHVNTPLKIAKEWNEQRENPLPEEIIVRIYERFDIPGSKYTWDKPLEKINLAEVELEEVLPRIALGIRNLEPLSFPMKSIPGYAEFYDRLTRQVINSFLQEEKVLRGNPEIVDIRKDVLKKAIAENLSLDQVENLLRERLQALV